MSKMKLYIEQLPGDGIRGKSFAIYDEEGRKMPGITSASVHHNKDDAARLDISLVVDGRDISFGKPVPPSSNE